MQERRSARQATATDADALAFIRVTSQAQATGGMQDKHQLCPGQVKGAWAVYFLMFEAMNKTENELPT